MYRRCSSPMPHPLASRGLQRPGIHLVQCSWTDLGCRHEPDINQTPTLRASKVSHFFESAHRLPLGVGVMLPATYETGGGTFVQYTERDKEQVPTGLESQPIMSVCRRSGHMSKSVGWSPRLCIPLTTTSQSSFRPNRTLRVFAFRRR